jgi:hypothetical protein
MLGQGPLQFDSFFRLDPNATRLHNRRHDKHLLDPRDGTQLASLNRSALGLIRVYNFLPQSVVSEMSVSRFQSALTKLIKRRAEICVLNWESTFSPRIDYMSHPLRKL